MRCLAYILKEYNLIAPKSFLSVFYLSVILLTSYSSFHNRPFYWPTWITRKCSKVSLFKMHLRSFIWAEPGFIYQTWDEYTNRRNSGNVIALIVNGLEKEPISSKAQRRHFVKTRCSVSVCRSCWLLGIKSICTKRYLNYFLGGGGLYFYFSYFSLRLSNSKRSRQKWNKVTQSLVHKRG